MSAARRLARALTASARAAGCTVRIAGESERAWASPTFVGAHHRMLLEGEPAEALERWLAMLPAAVPAVPGHVVADLCVERAGGEVRLAALMLDDAACGSR